jgi:hypothetical protein
MRDVPHSTAAAGAPNLVAPLLHCEAACEPPSIHERRMHMHRSARWITAFCLCLGIASIAASCRTGGARKASGEADRVTTIEVDNQGFNDMTIYVINGGARTRLGIAPGNRKTTLTIPGYLVSTTTFMRFFADPIGGNRTPVTEEIDVSPGDQLVMIINPGM